MKCDLSGRRCSLLKNTQSLPNFQRQRCGSNFTSQNEEVWLCCLCMNRGKTFADCPITTYCPHQSVSVGEVIAIRSTKKKHLGKEGEEELEIGYELYAE